MKIKDFEYFIIVDENRRPMAWSDCQLCYTDDESYLDELFPVKVYKMEQAKRHIRNTVKFRTDNGFRVGEYYLMPVLLPNK